MRFASNTRIGLTLIESVVLIAIIAILAAILSPMATRARAMTEQETCLSNIKKLTAACQVYAAEWDDYLPLQQCSWTYVDPDDPSTFVNQYWGQQIYPYVKNLETFMCPADPHSTRPVVKNPTDTCTGWTGSGSETVTNYHNYCFFRGYGISYGYNKALGYWDGAHWPMEIKQSWVKRPAQTIIIADAAPDTGVGSDEGKNECPAAPGLWNWGPCGTAPGLKWKCHGVASTHDRGANEAFADGHAKWLPFPENREGVIWDPDETTPGTCVYVEP